MSDLSAASKRTFVGKTDYLSIATAGNDTYYEGAMLIIDTDGYAAIPADTADEPPIGIYSGRQGQSFAVASGSHDRIEMEIGKVWVAFSGAAQSDVGELFYLTDDNTLTQTAGSKTWGVLALDYKSGYVLVDFANPVYIG